MKKIEYKRKMFVRNGYNCTLVDIVKTILILNDIMPILNSHKHFRKDVSIYENIHGNRSRR